MKIFSALLCSALLCFALGAREAWALKCKPFDLVTSLERYDIIFKGIAEKPVDTSKSDTSFEITPFKILKVWKGTVDKKVTIKAKTLPDYWYNVFETENTYLVFAERKNDSYYFPVCGAYFHLNAAADVENQLDGIFNKNGGNRNGN